LTPVDVVETDVRAETLTKVFALPNESAAVEDG
jgi:hypothetical protein